MLILFFAVLCTLHQESVTKHIKVVAIKNYYTSVPHMTVSRMARVKTTKMSVPQQQASKFHDLIEISNQRST